MGLSALTMDEFRNLWVPLMTLGYGCGSIPFGYWIVRRVTGRDVRSEGSGNVGATNVARVAGKRWGAVTLALDALKGALPVLAVLQMRPDAFVLHGAVGFAAFLGHVFPVWLRFKGGKGVATALGVTTVLVPGAALTGFAVWALVLAAFRISSVASLAGVVAAAVAAALLPTPIPAPYGATVLAFVVAIVWTHRANLRRLVERREKPLS